MTEMNDIEELMRTHLKNAEQAAPEGVWDEISQRMAGSAKATRRHTRRKAWIATSVATAILAVAAVIYFATATTTPAAVPDSPEVALLHNPELVAQPAVTETVKENAPAIKQTATTAPVAKVEQKPVESTQNVSTKAVATTPVAIAAPKEDIDNLLTPEIEEEEEYVPPVVSTPKQTTKKAPKQQVTDNKEAEQEKQQSQPKEEKQQIYIPIPNILTPNGDGYNDCWVIPDLEQYGKAQVQIFTAHSKRVFYTGNYRNDFCGAGLPDGDYFYIIVFRDINVTRRGVLVIQH